MDNAVEAALIRRLRDHDAVVMSGLFHAIPAMREAADTIERLLSFRSEVDRMREALEKISAEQWKDRSAVSELNAWPAFQKLNRRIVALYAIADAALSPQPPKGDAT